MQDCVTDSDSGSRPFLKGRPAVDRGMDFPVLGLAGAEEAGAALCHGSRGPLRYCHVEKCPLVLRACNRPRYYEMTAVIGEYSEEVNGVQRHPCKSQGGDINASKGQCHRH